MKMKKYCSCKNCSDEMIGVFAIGIGIIAYIIQLTYTEKTLDINSFSIAALILATISELFFAIQGILKRSITITLTRVATSIAAITFVIIWFVEKSKEEKI